MRPDDPIQDQDEAVTAADFAADEAADGFDFGNWPEIAGGLAAAALTWLIFAFTG
ncbi:hypothetical protein PJ900_25535 [Tistrella mobilis]|uniref:hypothetical protein n=1 Tax=Tistrella mobilis TaxID=171437 RepID=UPI0018D34CAE|nr:hypothetical protein [Tistrella mobilis]